MVARANLLRQPAAVHLGLDLVRDELLVDEPAREFLDLAIEIGQGTRWSRHAAKHTPPFDSAERRFNAEARR
jgi:hypothetical protein